MQLQFGQDFAGVEAEILDYEVVLLWLGGLWVVSRVQNDPAWTVEMPGSRRGRRSRREDHPEESRPYSRQSTTFVAGVFGLAALVTLGAGVALQESGNVLADRMGLQGAIFGTGPALRGVGHPQDLYTLDPDRLVG